VGRPRAILFDFNGTLSHDEPILCEIFMELFAEHGKPLSAQEYFDVLAGLSDPEIVRTWLGRDHPDVDQVIEERIVRYRAAVADGSSVPTAVREAVRYAAERVPLAIVSGAARAEIEPVISAAGIAECFRAIVPAEDVEHGKPHPDGYRRAHALLGQDIDAGDVLVIEDTEAGIAAAKGAGMRCIAVLGTLAPARLAEAEEIVEGIDLALVQRLLEQE
jgi:beta-phosphoglucomutase-like phosphatase (HAD superfamily)